MGSPIQRLTLPLVCLKPSNNLFCNVVTNTIEQKYKVPPNDILLSSFDLEVLAKSHINEVRRLYSVQSKQENIDHEADEIREGFDVVHGVVLHRLHFNVPHLNSHASSCCSKI